MRAKEGQGHRVLKSKNNGGVESSRWTGQIFRGGPGKGRRGLRFLFRKQGLMASSDNCAFNKKEIEQ